MNSNQMFYREILPSESYSNLVLSFWEFTVSREATAPIQHEVFPDGCVSLFYHRNENFGLARVFLSGLNLASLKTPVFAGDNYWGMRIAPAACAQILRANPARFLTEKVCEAIDFPHLTENLLSEFNNCRSFAEGIAVYEKRLREMHFKANDFDEKVARAVRLIEETGGEIKIAELAEKVDLGARQLERRFKQNSGLTPKQFVRLRRIRATAVNLVENEKSSWAHRAAEMGFADQSHLSHELVSVTGRAPNSFAEKVMQIEHGDLV